MMIEDEIEDESLPPGSEMESEMETETETEGEDTFFVPSSIGGGKECKAGDKLTFEVLGKDSDGNYEVKLSGMEATDVDDFDADLRKVFAKGGSNG